MNRKIIFVLMVLFLAVASLSSVSAWWIFGDGGEDITVDDVDFHMPEGFEYYELPGHKADEADYAIRTDDGQSEYIHIFTSTGRPYNFGNDYTEKSTINGKECYINTHSIGNIVYCTYQSDDKYIQLNVPYSYEYKNNVFSYEETLKQMIK